MYTFIPSTLSCNKEFHSITASCMKICLLNIIIPFPDWWLLAYLAIPSISDHHHLNLFWIYSVAFENGDEGAAWRREAGCSCSLYCSLALCQLILAFSPLLSFLPLNWCFHEAIVITPKHINTLVTMLSLRGSSSAISPPVFSASAHSHSSSTAPFTLPPPVARNPQQLEQSILGWWGRGSCF